MSGLVAIAVLAAGCGESAVEPAADVEPSPPPAMLTETAVGAVPEARMRANLALFARHLARALEDPSARAVVLSALDESPYSEGKVHFRDFLTAAGAHEQRGTSILDAMALSANLGGRDELLARLDSVWELELYLPVPEHRQAWSGDANLVVATTLFDHEEPVGFGLDGGLVPLSSLAPPATPVLAVVPAEGLLRRDPAPLMTEPCDPESSPEPCDDPGGSGTQRGTPSSPGVWMNASTIYDDHEGWLLGNPEFEIMTADRATSSGLFNREVQCAGEHAETTSDQPGIRSSAFVFDQNTTNWEGLVQIATIEQMDEAQAIDNGAIFMVWEDDNTACRIRQSEGNVFDWIEDAAAFALNGWAFQQKGAFQATLIAVSLLSKPWELFSALNSDDFVGLAIEGSELNENLGQFTHGVVNENGDLTGKLNLIVEH